MKLRTHLKTMFTAALLVMLCIIQASAVEYGFDGADDYLFADPTSQETTYSEENPNVNRSKTAALIPPGFGTPTSYLPGSGEYLTPNLAPGGMDAGLVNTVGSSTSAYYPPAGNVGSDSITSTIGYTDVTSNLYYSAGHLGTLRIPAIGVNVKIYQGTDSTTLAKGAGHFSNTSIWDGNVCVAAHNRGVNSYFGQIHTLNIGDEITLTTKLGTRTYTVTSIQKVHETDSSATASTSGNRITLFTCVRNERDYRWCVTALEKIV